MMDDIYVGGNGVWKSSDGGVNWIHLYDITPRVMFMNDGDRHFYETYVQEFDTSTMRVLHCRLCTWTRLSSAVDMSSTIYRSGWKHFKSDHPDTLTIYALM